MNYPLLESLPSNIMVRIFEHVDGLKVLLFFDRPNRFIITNLLKLQNISIGPLTWFHKLPNLYDKIFNGFPRLQSLELRYLNEISNLTITKPLLFLRILTVTEINLNVFQAILSACPNLHTFKFGIPCVPEGPVDMEPHLELREMIITSNYSGTSLNDYGIDHYLSCVPNLEELYVHRSNKDDNIDSLTPGHIRLQQHIPYTSKPCLRWVKKCSQYNWLATSVNQRLPSLRRFEFYFIVYSAEKFIPHNENFINLLEENFNHAHDGKPQYRLVVIPLRQSVHA